MVDVLAPYLLGGKIGLFRSARMGKIVLIMELHICMYIYIYTYIYI